jgi:leucine dehydrogenase
MNNYPSSAIPHFTQEHDLFEYADHLGFGELHFCNDHESGLRAIIAIHSPHRIPTLGGCRFLEYPDTASALKDAMRLAQGMSYKAALYNLPVGGGKAVILKPKKNFDRVLLLKRFAQFIDSLQGRYITAKDSGSTTADMDVIAKYTPYVSSTTVERDGLSGNPSPYTAEGVLRAIETAVEFKYHKKNLGGLHVAIQGVGTVGHSLAEKLHKQGVKLTVCDTNADAAERLHQELGVTVVSTNQIYGVECDIFSPCALGAILNDETIPLLKAPIIVGAANNQLAHTYHGKVLQEKGILYAPDYVVNAGGLIHVCAQHFSSSHEKAMEQIDHISDILLGIFKQAAEMNEPTNIIADHIAKERLSIN